MKTKYKLLGVFSFFIFLGIQAGHGKEDVKRFLKGEHLLLSSFRTNEQKGNKESRNSKISSAKHWEFRWPTISFVEEPWNEQENKNSPLAENFEAKQEDQAIKENKENTN